MAGGACMHAHRTSWKRQGKKKKKDEKGQQKVDLYALLGLANERWTATEAQIKLGAAHRLLGTEHAAGRMPSLPGVQCSLLSVCMRHQTQCMRRCRCRRASCLYWTANPSAPSRRAVMSRASQRTASSFGALWRLRRV